MVSYGTSSIVGSNAAQNQIVNDTSVNKVAVAYLQNMLSLCRAAYCRSQAMRDNTGSYARAFARGEGSVYIGYSETIHYGLNETAESCRLNSSCLTESDIAVRALPRLNPDKSETGVGWVDALAIGANLADRKKAVALDFIRFVTSETAYRAILSPEWPLRSRYLLPGTHRANHSRRAPLRRVPACTLRTRYGHTVAPERQAARESRKSHLRPTD